MCQELMIIIMPIGQNADLRKDGPAYSYFVNISNEIYCLIDIQLVVLNYSSFILK